MNYSKLLVKVRDSKWSIEEISGLTSIPEIILYKILRGKEEIGEAGLLRLADVLGCEVEEILGE